MTTTGRQVVKPTLVIGYGSSGARVARLCEQQVSLEHPDLTGRYPLLRFRQVIPDESRDAKGERGSAPSAEAGATVRETGDLGEDIRAMLTAPHTLPDEETRYVVPGGSFNVPLRVHVYIVVDLADKLTGASFVACFLDRALRACASPETCLSLCLMVGEFEQAAVPRAEIVTRVDAVRQKVGAAEGLTVPQVYMVDRRDASGALLAEQNDLEEVTAAFIECLTLSAAGTGTSGFADGFLWQGNATLPFASFDVRGVGMPSSALWDYAVNRGRVIALGEALYDPGNESDAALQVFDDLPRSEKLPPLPQLRYRHLPAYWHFLLFYDKSSLAVRLEWATVAWVGDVTGWHKSGMNWLRNECTKARSYIATEAVKARKEFHASIGRLCAMKRGSLMAARRFCKDTKNDMQKHVCDPNPPAVVPRLDESVIEPEVRQVQELICACPAKLERDVMLLAAIGQVVLFWLAAVLVALRGLDFGEAFLWPVCFFLVQCVLVLWFTCPSYWRLCRGWKALCEKADRCTSANQEELERNRANVETDSLSRASRYLTEIAEASDCHLRAFEALARSRRASAAAAAQVVEEIGRRLAHGEDVPREGRVMRPSHAHKYVVDERHADSFFSDRIGEKPFALSNVLSEENRIGENIMQGFAFDAYGHIDKAIQDRCRRSVIQEDHLRHQDGALPALIETTLAREAKSVCVLLQTKAAQMAIDDAASGEKLLGLAAGTNDRLFGGKNIDPRPDYVLPFHRRNMVYLVRVRWGIPALAPRLD